MIDQGQELALPAAASCRKLFAAVAVLLGLFISPAGWCKEIRPFSVDLDGDGKAETVTLSTTAADADGQSRYSIRVGSATYAGDYYAQDGGEILDLRAIAVDGKRLQRQLFLEIQEPGSCIYHLVAFSGKKLVRLLQFDGGPGCFGPEVLGNGEVEVSTWKGFWRKKDRYSLSADGLALIYQKQTIYDVQEAAGVVTRKLSLKGASCAERTVLPGTPVRVSRFDSQNSRYFLESADGACGWVPGENLNELIRDLPWAG